MSKRHDPVGDVFEEASTRQPAPLSWKPLPLFRERLLRAVGTPALVGVALFAAAVVVAITVILLRPHSVEAPLNGSVEAEDIVIPDEEWDGVGGTAAERAETPVYVHVVGEVRAPGVVELAYGARVQDALEAAGGVTESAALSGLNLARIVADGEQVVVPDADGETPVPPPSSGAADGQIDINTADASALDSLPRVGPALAQRIVDWREANGRFGSIDQLLQVEGIGLKTLEGLRDRVRV